MPSVSAWIGGAVYNAIICLNGSFGTVLCCSKKRKYVLIVFNR
jgi:hypothetical protein